MLLTEAQKHCLNLRHIARETWQMLSQESQTQAVFQQFRRYEPGLYTTLLWFEEKVTPVFTNKCSKTSYRCCSMTCTKATELLVYPHDQPPRYTLVTSDSDWLTDWGELQQYQPWEFLLPWPQHSWANFCLSMNSVRESEFSYCVTHYQKTVK